MIIIMIIIIITIILIFKIQSLSAQAFKNIFQYTFTLYMHVLKVAAKFVYSDLIQKWL